jgi:hypothetical protein
LVPAHGYNNFSAFICKHGTKITGWSTLKVAYRALTIGSFN